MHIYIYIIYMYNNNNISIIIIIAVVVFIICVRDSCSRALSFLYVSNTNLFSSLNCQSYNTIIK